MQLIWSVSCFPVLGCCSGFDARPVDSEVGTQPLLQQPRTVTAHYAAGDSEEGDGKVSNIMYFLPLPVGYHGLIGGYH